MILKNAKIVCEKEIIDQGWLEITNDIITDIGYGSTDKPGIDLTGKILMPGFIDCHTHGGYGQDTEKATIESFDYFAKSVVQEGITKFCQTVITGSDETLANVLAVYQQYMQNHNYGAKARQIGAHLEGPFISLQYKGAHDPSLLIKPNIDLLKKWIKISGDNIKIVTYAPEEQDGTFTDFLLAHNIIPSLGHSNVTFQRAEEEIQRGAQHVTHLYNAMSKFDHRNPGLVFAAWMNKNVLCELITDGIHLHPEVVKFTYQVKGADGICLITDSMNAKGLPDGVYKFGPLSVVKTGQKVVVEGTDTIAGSAATFDHCVRNFAKITNCDLITLAKVSSTNIAEQLGISNTTGSLQTGKLADIVVLDEKLTVQQTICEGAIVWQK